MCNIYNRTRKQIGYKVLAYKKGKFYSIFTGQQMTIGDVPKAPRRCNILTSGWNEQLDYKRLKECSFYNEKYDGKTGAFIKLNHALNLSSSRFIYGNLYKLVIVKIKLAGIIYKGDYGYKPIIAGTKIKSIEIVKTI